MCGRYNFKMTNTMASLFNDLGLTTDCNNLLNITPTESVPIIMEQDGHRTCTLARWWLTPSWSNGPDTKYAMFNARAENLETSRAYKGPFRHQRCIIPATSFIEWNKDTKGKQPYEIFRSDEQPIVFAGLWDCWNNDLVSCSIVTTQATQSIEAIHQRMPVMLNPENTKLWLDMNTNPSALTEVMKNQVPDTLTAHPIDIAINNGRNKIAPVSTGADIALE